MIIEVNNTVFEPKLLRERDSADLLMELMLRGLWVNDDDHNAIAVELLTRFGECGFRRLMRVAANPELPSEHRIRALLIIRRLGIILDRASYTDLCILTRDASADVAVVATDLVKTLRQVPEELCSEWY